MSSTQLLRGERGVILSPIMKLRQPPSIGGMLYLNPEQNRCFLRHFHLIFAREGHVNWEARLPVLASGVHPNQWIFRSATTKN